MDRFICLVFLLMGFVKSSDAICPNECFCYQEDTFVDCSGRGLTKLPENLDDEVTFLDASDNLLDSIPPTLSRLEKLEHLDLSYNNIGTLKEFDLVNNKRLRKINLSFNKFSSWLDLDNRSFQNLPVLEDLSLKSNDFNDLGNFEDRYLVSDSIKNLSLANCSIQNLNSNILNGLINIITLDLSYNNITVLNSTMISNTLVNLDLTNAGLHRIYDPFTQLSAFQKLKIPYNNHLKFFYGKSSSLIHINATQCGLDSLPRGHFPKLKFAIFRENVIRSLPAKAFSSMENINEIDLSSNKIRDIDPEAFYGVKNIQYIDLSYNVITYLDPRTFNSNFRLVLLKLSYNYLKEVVKIDSESLRGLVISNCEIINFNKDSLRLMPSLQYLDLSSNDIRAIPDFLETNSLETLDISSCRISRITNATFAAMPRLRKLSMKGNRLISDVRPSYFYNIIELYLSDNSWRCDCGNSDFKDLYYWLISGSVTTSIHDLVCQSPEHVQGQKWGVACYEVWNHRADKAWIYSVIILLMLVAFFCVIISIKKNIKRRARREMRERQQNIAEARERLQRMREQEREARMTESTNAPDPRELQNPPTYAEALSLPKLNTSQGSLIGGSQGSLGGSTTNLKGGKKRRRRRRRVASADDLRRTTDSDSEHNNNTSRGGYFESDV